MSLRRESSSLSLGTIHPDKSIVYKLFGILSHIINLSIVFNDGFELAEVAFLIRYIVG